MSRNKSYIVLRENGAADPVANYRFFVEAPEDFDQLARSRFATMRARVMYAQSVAYDPTGNALYTVTVPNERVRTLVVSRFDRRDMVLSAEFVPAVGAGLSLGTERRLDEFYVTGATVVGQHLLAVSAAFSTLLTIDLRTEAVVAAHALGGIGAPAGLAVKGNELLVADAGGRVWVLPAPWATPP